MGTGLALLGPTETTSATLLTPGAAATPLLEEGAFHAQECSRLLLAMAPAGVRCKALERAAGKRPPWFDFP